MKSLLDPLEVNRARSGPRELKPPTSKAYAIQTVYHLRRVLEAMECDEQEVKRELEEIDRYEHWRVLGYQSREAMFDAELGELSERAKQNLERALGQHGGKRTKGQADNIRLQYGTERRTTLARLHRDHQDLADRVERGELSANAAAIEAGFRRRTVSIPLVPAAFVRVIRARFTAAEIQEIIDGLQ